ncbi:peptidase [Chloroherpeton thalassium ATCC 35110]|uniref:Peptidase n=1 Tax=Chloroherpeton thalassium (strain ATCC 35110 / GB-78) TaxID=517418 RepID=B3QSI6_CHLT3|nr:M1 family metallopeptidase [Chloroherpeton thalassium]ACF12577.1 peptidase [Chloroherpeton thalassium ATCC 35110]
MRLILWTFSLLFFLFNARVSYSQTDAARRPIPYPVRYSNAFKEAVHHQTRTLNGAPGKAYWSNPTRYTLHALLSPETKMLQGQATISYTNQSPDTLSQLVVQLRQNLHKEGAIRNREVETTDGMQLSKVMVNGQHYMERRLRSRTGYKVQGTLMYISLYQDLYPGETAELAFSWNFQIPDGDSPRMGQDGEVFFLGYWYPQMAVYDDIQGWNDDLYMGNAEFYMDYADYDVNITVPEGWLIAATGELQNPEEVLSTETLTKLEQARESDEVTTIVDKTEQFPGVSTRTSESGLLTWHFTAENVRDFAFGTSDRYVWDAIPTNISGKKIMVHSFYRWGTSAWKRAAEFARYSVEYLSSRLVPYPYPNLSVVEGIIGGGMEYPMITLIGGRRTDFTLFSVVFHEIAHNWFPMLVGSNETQFAWMDEGLVTYYTNEGKETFFTNDMVWEFEADQYEIFSETDTEIEPMRHADLFPISGIARRVGCYNKPALALRALQGVFGYQLFNNAMRLYIDRWTNKHPQPFDFFNTFEQVTGKNLDWFWTSFFYETWPLDQAISEVKIENGQTTVFIEDLGLLPMPVLVCATLQDSSLLEKEIPVEHWLQGNRTAEITFESNKVKKVDLDPQHFFPDINRKNNSWSLESAP